MGRDSYDDMVSPDRQRRGRGTNRITGLIVVFGILICAIALLVFMILSPQDAGTSSVETQTPVTVEIRQPETLASSVATTPAADDAPVSDPASGSVQDEQPEVPAQDEAVTSQSVRPAADQTAGRVSAIDLVSAQNIANFDNSDVLLYMPYVLQEGDSLDSVAQRFGLTVDTLVSVNGIRNIAAIGPGVELQIPNMNGQLYVVQEGDMLSTIAHRFNPDLGWKTLMDINGLKSESIRVGQKLFIPDMDSGQESSSIQQVSLSFSMPVDGTVYGSYGQYVDGQNLQGVLIAAGAGSAVRAAADGIVVDAGRVDGDSGRFLVIQHDQGYKTTYSNLETVVSSVVGSEVTAGQVIGTIGSAGRSYTRPTLYFQIEQGGILLNPQMFI